MMGPQFGAGGLATASTFANAIWISNDKLGFAVS